MTTKNLKHGIKVTKRDVVLATGYVLMFNTTSAIGNFSTKLDALNRLSEILQDSSYKIDNFILVRTQHIKI